LKIAFVNPNLKYNKPNYPRPPLGLLSLATVCKAAGYDVQIIDANALNLQPEDIPALVDNCPVVCLTAMTASISETVKIAEQLWNKILILGGVHASIFPRECYNTGYFDLVVAGEGEQVLVELLDTIQSSRPVGGVKFASPVLDLNSFPLPDYSLLDMSRYIARYPHAVKPPWTAVSTSRGCPYQCSFCSKSVSGSNFRALSSDRVIELINTLQTRHGINDITFYDDIMPLNKNRMSDICNGIIGSDIELTWTCESRVNLANAELLNEMRHAGCRLIFYGIESGSQKILNSINKGIKLDQIRQAISLTKEAGIQAAGYFMLGAPGETLDTLDETLRFARSLELDHAQFSVCSPLPGSKLWDDWVSTNPSIPAWDNFKYLAPGDKPMFTNDELDAEYIEETVKEANEYYSGVKNVK
jgi:anaerobic magnesium-protoporphyrin IX monomethyl ester cyclase